MNLRPILQLYVLLFSLLVHSGCAAPGIKSEFDQEIDQLYRHLPSEMIRVDGMFQTWDEKWQVGYQVRRYHRNLTEFVRPPETVENWTELLTVDTQYRTSKVYPYPGGATFVDVPDPAVALQLLRQTVQERCAKPITFQPLHEDRTSPYPSVIFSISCDYPARELKGASVKPGLSETQVHRIFRGQHAYFHVFRSRHGATLEQATLDHWVRGFKALYVCNNGVPGQECEKKKQ